MVDLLSFYGSHVGVDFSHPPLLVHHPQLSLCVLCDKLGHT